MASGRRGGSELGRGVGSVDGWAGEMGQRGGGRQKKYLRREGERSED